MKINEIVTEAKERGKLRQSVSDSLSDIQSYPSLDNNSNPYLAYRFGVALAKSPRDVTAKEGPIGSEFTTIGYSDADQEIIDRASKEFGIKPRRLSKKGSAELNNVNKTSPVAKPKKNKYGV